MSAPEIHERIWLEPTETDPDNGRQWCQQNVWGDDATEYVLASSVSTLQARVEELEEALKFYADAWCFTTHPKRPGLEWKPKEALLDDCGNIARAALQGGSNA